MKKLALALACLVSLAFFASCNPEGQPTIGVLVEEGYVTDGASVNVNDTVNFGFSCVSSLLTGKPLASLVVSVENFDTEGTSLGSGEYARKDLTGMTEYLYKDAIIYSTEKDDLVGTSVITAIVTDEAGQIASASIVLNIYDPAQPLTAVDFEWYRLGNTQTGLEEYGLFWERNIKDTHAQIKPLDGVTLYSFSADKWEATTTDVEKAALFADGAITMTVYNNVSTTAGGTYNDVIGTKMADGTLHLINVTKCVIGEYQSQGYPITISGQAK